MHCFVTTTLFTKILAYNTFRSELQLAATKNKNTRTSNADAVPIMQLRQNLKAPSVSHHSL